MKPFLTYPLVAAVARLLAATTTNLQFSPPDGAPRAAQDPHSIRIRVV